MDAATKKAAEDRLKEMLRQDSKATSHPKPFLLRRKGATAAPISGGAPTAHSAELGEGLRGAVAAGGN